MKTLPTILRAPTAQEIIANPELNKCSPPLPKLLEKIFQNEHKPHSSYRNPTTQRIFIIRSKWFVQKKKPKHYYIFRENFLPTRYKNVKKAIKIFES